ncbi:MAG: exopolyphosphatase/guanosine-5'-triphosphate,3'-diphosphate pyrophosphatase [Hyphomicrobiaceae bacterium]
MKGSRRNRQAAGRTNSLQSGDVDASKNASGAVPTDDADTSSGKGGGVAPAGNSHGSKPREANASDSNAPNSNAPNSNGWRRRRGANKSPDQPVYAALDLGTNNCRLLIARPTRRGFQVIDAFSRIIRLGEGVSVAGYLSDDAIDRTMDALRVCASKMVRNNVTRSQLVATEACRAASNGTAFIERVRRDIGMDLKVLSQEIEAQLAVSGCATLIDEGCDHALVFDIGGGSSELIWLDVAKRRRDQAMASCNERLDPTGCIEAWTSLPIGVVSLAEKFGGKHVQPQDFEDMVNWVAGLIKPFEDKYKFRERISEGRVHFLGTSGTVTTVAGIQLRLPKYDRRRVDGCWLNCTEVRKVTYDLLEQTYEQRVAQPCIGRDRADLVLAGCAILEALMRTWPTKRLRVADRGLREGMLTNMMAEDGFYSKA